MLCSTLNQAMNLCRHESHTASAGETVAEKSQEFAEESTFFLSLFKNRTVKPMPDEGLMLILQKDKTRRKERKISKKENPEKLYFTSKQPQDKSMEEDEPQELT